MILKYKNINLLIAVHMEENSLHQIHFRLIKLQMNQTQTRISNATTTQTTKQQHRSEDWQSSNVDG
jgi:hypothetical protein